MNAKTRKKLIAGVALLLVFIVFTVLARTVDVQAIGPQESEVGFAALNGAAHEKLCGNATEPVEPFYKLSKYMGYLALLLIAVFGVCGLMQLIKRGSLKKVDYRILLLGAFYIVVGACYVLFDKVVEINFRPVLEADGSLEASYPSSHTVLAVCVLLSAPIAFPAIVGKGLRKPLNAVCFALCVAIIVTRALSGVHWLTDILAGLVLSAALLALYAAAVSHVRSKLVRIRKRKRKKKI